MGSELRNRLLVGPILAGVMILVIVGDITWQSPVGCTVIFVIISIFGGREFLTMVRQVVPGVQRLPVMLLAPILTAAPLLSSLTAEKWFPQQQIPLTEIVLACGLGWVTIRQFGKNAFSNAAANLGATILGILYLGVLPGFLTHLVLIAPEGNTSQGHQLLMIALAAAKVGDIFAFTGGKLFGRHKMAPKLSPGKTWEGFASAMLGSVAGTFIFAAFLTLFDLPPALDVWWKMLIWGLAIGPVGVLGDLLESAFKRDSSVKDSGATIPGFGGMLDVVDAILLVAPVAYILAIFLG